MFALDYLLPQKQVVRKCHLRYSPNTAELLCRLVSWALTIVTQAYQDPLQWL